MLGDRTFSLAVPSLPFVEVRVKGVDLNQRASQTAEPTVFCTLLPPRALCAVGGRGYRGKERGRRVRNWPDSEIELPQHPIRRMVIVKPILTCRVAHGTHARRHELLTLSV